jgi:hypothetical protein
MVSLGTPPFSASSSWNTPVSDSATFTKLNWPASTGYNYSVAWDSYSPAVYVASPSDPLVQVTYPPGWGYPGGTISVHMPAAANGAAGTDGELIVIDGDVAYNFWQFKRTSTSTGTAASFGAENVVTGDGWGSKSPFLSAGITAAGSSQLGGLLVKAETADGSIDHALQLVVDSKLVLPGAVGSAIASDGSSASGIVKEGQLLAIPKGTPMPAGLSPLGQEVFTAMQKYGAYVVDVAGGTTTIRAQSNDFDDATMTALWHDMGKITPLLAGVSGQSSSGSGSSGDTGGGTAPSTGNPSATDTTAPIVQWVATNGPGITNGSGTVGVGDTVRLTLKMSEAVNVTSTPTLSLNDNGIAKYVSGSGTDVLQFDYKVAAGQNTADLAISGYNLSGITDTAGNAVNTSGAPLQPAGTLVVDTKVVTDTTAPIVQWVAANGPGVTNGNGTVGVGDTVRLTLKMSEAVNVTGTPTLSLNDNGIAKYVSGSGTDVLQFDYKVAAGQNTADLAISGYNLSGIADQAGNAVNIAGAPLQPAGTLVVDTKSFVDPNAPKIQWISATGSGIRNGTGVVGTGGTVRLSVNFNEAVTVTGTPSLSLNSNGTAKYVSGSGTNTLQFDYKVAAGDRASDLEVSGYNLSGVTDRDGNAVNLSGAPHQPAGTLAIRTGSSNQRTATVNSSIADLAAPATLQADASTASVPSNTPTTPSFDLNAQTRSTIDALGGQMTLGYSGSQGAGASSPQTTGSVMPQLALLSQYAASSFATTAATFAGASAQQWFGDTTQTLAKSLGR